jgi:hypothetical protein
MENRINKFISTLPADKQPRRDYFNDLIALIGSRVSVESNCVGWYDTPRQAYYGHGFSDECSLEDFIISIQLIRDRQNADERKRRKAK